MNGRLRLLDAARTDVGKVRQVNEDSYYNNAARGLWAVADGMGGHANGQWASQVVAGAMAQAPLAGDFEPDTATLARCLYAANAHIFSRSRTALEGQTAGSTAVALLIQEPRFAVLWAGDSRAYLLRDSALHRLTRDHTQVQDMVDQGLLRPEEAAIHPMSHVITRAVGADEALEVDMVTDVARPGDVFMLCSDGLHGVVGEAEIAEILRQARPAAAGDRLLARALEAGAPDNVTLIIVACDEVTLRTSPPPSADLT